jgi:hypothetical protein
MRQGARAVAATLILSAVPLESNGFWSFSTGASSVHELITQTALAAPVYRLNGDVYAFSQRAIDAINAVHPQVDSTLDKSYQATDHFDSQTLQLSLATLSFRRQRLVDELSSSQPQAEHAWIWMGLMLHAVQDFYSHSTWVYLGNVGIVNFGALTQPLLVPSSFPDLNAPFESCQPDQKTVLTLSVLPFSSGYFPPLSPPPGKCNHGGRALSVLQCQSPVDIKDGMNLDGPGSCQTGVNIALADRAINLAGQETTVFVQSLISQLQAGGNLKGGCILMDIPNIPTGSGNAPCLLRTITTLTIPTAASADSPLTIDVAVTPADPSISGGKIPSGQVQIQSSIAGLQCVAVLDSTGHGSCSVTPIHTGFLELIGDYQGDANFGVSHGWTSTIVGEPLFTLTVIVNGGGGVVTSSPSGINCSTGGSGCSAKFANTTQLTLSATPDSADVFFFDSWVNCPMVGPGSIGVPGSGTCSLTITADIQIQANFVQHVLTVPSPTCFVSSTTSSGTPPAPVVHTSIYEIDSTATGTGTIGETLSVGTENWDYEPKSCGSWHTVLGSAPTNGYCVRNPGDPPNDTFTFAMGAGGSQCTKYSDGSIVCQPPPVGPPPAAFRNVHDQPTYDNLVNQFLTGAGGPTNAFAPSSSNVTSCPPPQF